jgi:hypothetical protein
MHRHYVPNPQVKKVSLTASWSRLETYISQLSFFTILGYHTATYFTKFSILAFYSNLFPASSPKLRKVCYAVIGYTICSYITAMFLAIFWCGSKPSRNWAPGKNGCSLWDYTLFKTNFALNLSSDIFSTTKIPAQKDLRKTDGLHYSLRSSFPCVSHPHVVYTPSHCSLRYLRSWLDHNCRQHWTVHGTASKCLCSTLYEWVRIFHWSSR